MVEARSKFTGGDPNYLRDIQYRDGSRLARRANLHAKYRTAPTSFFDWVGPRFDLFEGAEVLEVGCGTGWLWQESTFAIPAGVDLTLTDLSPGMVAEAVTRVETSHRVHKVTGQTADLQSLPFEDDSFDRVIANHMLYHLPDPARGVAELARVVRPGGRVVASTNGPQHLSELWEIRAEVFDTAPIDETATVFSPEIGFELLRKHFTELHWYDYADHLVCTDPADVLAHICSAPPAETATAAQLSRLTSEVERAFNAGGGKLIVSKEVGCFSAGGREANIPRAARSLNPGGTGTDGQTRARQLKPIVDSCGLAASVRDCFVEKMVAFGEHSARSDAIEHSVTPETETGIADDGFPVVWGIAWRVRSASWLLHNRRLLEDALQT